MNAAVATAAQTTAAELGWHPIGDNRWEGPGGEIVLIEIMVITPEWAQEMLYGGGKKEVRNFRDQNPREVAKLKDQLVNDLWRFNGATIVFDSDGCNRDGQKRLQACIDTGIPFVSIVVWGVDGDADLTMDTGEKRTLGQFLKHAKEKNYTTLSAAINWLWRIDNNKELWTIGCSTREGIAMLHRNPSLRDSVAATWLARTYVPQGLATAIHFACARKAPTEADKFFELIGTGVNLIDDDPIMRLRRRMDEDARSKTKLKTAEIAALIIIAWNYWIAGRTIKFLRWRAVGPAAQPFPKIKFPNE